MGNGLGPLAGVRVVDLTDDLGRYAGKLLAEMGADVVRLRAGEPGPALTGADHGGLLDWWFDGGTTAVALDLDVEADRTRFAALVAAADILIETEAPGRLDDLGLGAAALAAANPRLVHVSLTPFGADGPRSHWQGSDLIAAASGGILSVTGYPDEPVNLWGRQMANAGGFYAAITALAGLVRVRARGRGSHADLSLQQAVASCTEHLLMFWYFPQALAGLGAPIADRQASLHWIRAYEVVPCKRGYCMVSPSAGGVPDLIAWMKSHGVAQDVPDVPQPSESLMVLPKLMKALHEFAPDFDATELYERGQAMHVPFGEVLTVPQVVDCPQHRFRGWFRPVPGTSIAVPGPLAHFTDDPCGPPLPPPEVVTSPDAVLARWVVAGRAEVAPVSGDVGTLPLEGLRVVDFTHVLAGPFATRILADLGADVIKVQTEGRTAGTSANDFPYFPMWNRTKRSFCLEMGHPDAADALRKLVEQSDVVIENFSAGVLGRWGVGWEQLRAWNPRLIYVAMQGAGSDGPWRDYVTFAPTVHALCGLTALTGPEGHLDCGSGVAFNDHTSGLAGALAVLAALEARSRSGQGQFIDVSQLEVGSYLVGPALMDWMANGNEATAAGNREAYSDPVPNEVVQAADGEWLAVTVRDDADWARLAPVLGLADAGLEAVSDRRERRDEIGAALAAWASTQGAADGAEVLQDVDVPAYLVQNARHLVEEDPQLLHRGLIVDMDSPIWEHQQTDRYPAVLRDAGGTKLVIDYRHSPYLGEHTFEVAAELLGLDDGQVAEGMGDGLFV